MRKLQDQRGYALILTLLIITLIFMFSAPLISATLSNAKQIKKSEVSLQALDITEMGVIYYTTAIQEAFKEVFTNPTTIGQLEERYNSLYTQLATIPKTKVADGETKTFNIEKITPEKIKFDLNDADLINVTSNDFTFFLDKETNTYGVSFITRGYMNDVSKSLIINLEYQLTPQNGDPNNPPGTGGGGGGLDYEIPPPNDSDLSANCPNISSFDGNDCVYNEDRTYYENVNFSDGATVKINGDATFHEGINTFQDSTLYVTGDVQMIEKLNNVQQNGYIHVGGNFTVPEINNIDGSSRIEVEGDLTISTRINNSKGSSTIMVGGNLTLGEELNNLMDSLIVVYKDAYFNGVNSLKGSSKICVFGDIYGADPATNGIYIPSNPDFENACGMYRGDDGGLIFDPDYNENTNTNIEYDYN